LKPVFQFRIKVYKTQETNGLLMKLQYPADIIGVHIFLTEDIIIHT
jgi:hypothetical protein